MSEYKNAKIEWEWVGLRPHREPLRLEKEEVTNAKNKNILVNK